MLDTLPPGLILDHDAVVDVGTGQVVDEMGACAVDREWGGAGRRGKASGPLAERPTKRRTEESIPHSRRYARVSDQ
jgi:hypothetical protein